VIGPDIATALVDVIVPLAHEIGVPHEEFPSQDNGGTSPALVAGGVVATLGLAGGLIWVRERSRKADESAALERDADADPDQQDAGPALEPGDHARPGQEPA
jgi:hypothetical protein